jgi:arylsulfatase A-like enzyme
MTMRSRIAALAAAGSVFLGALFIPAGSTSEHDPRWNFIVIITDDQSADSLPHDPPAMPYLQQATGDPDEHWIVFRNGYVNTPLCCPSRATMLTGRYAHEHGVLTNDHGQVLDESATIAAWLDDAGYHTGLVGKYLNLYPFDRGPYVPQGWDRWWGKEQGSRFSLYRDFTLLEQGIPRHFGDAEEEYSTDVLADRAIEFLQQAPSDEPFFLWFAPLAPHPPWVSPARHAGMYARMPISTPPSIGEPDVTDKPAWVQGLPGLDLDARVDLLQSRRESFETLIAVDEAIRRIVEALEARGDLDHTVIVYVSDNGFSFGEHRWVKKTCPYEECARVPFLIRYPFADRRVEHTLVSAVDLAPTIADLAGVQPTIGFSGASLTPLLAEGDASGLPDSVYSEWAGDETIPQWWQIRTPEFAYIELATGERELYDLVADPYQLDNVVEDPGYAGDVDVLAATLDSYRAS